MRAVEGGIGRFQPREDAECLDVVAETSPRRHGLIENLLADVAERGVTEIVGKRDRLGKILVDSQTAGDGPGNLRHLEGMGHASAVMVAVDRGEDLCLVHQTTERPAVKDAVTISLVIAAIAGRPFGETTATARPLVCGIGCWRHGAPLLLHRMQD